MPSKQKSSHNEVRKQAHSEARRPVWAEVSLGALAHNLAAIREYVNPPEENRKTPRKILSIVKGNAYGHGGPQVAKALEKAGSDWFGVTCTDEGIAVRENGVRKPILVLTGFVPGEETRLLKYDLTPAVHRCDQLPLLERAAARASSRKRATFHLKLSGVFSHFASSGVFTDDAVGRQTQEQEECLYAALDRLRALGIDPGLVHLANSAAIVSRPETWADMVRPGAILYGYHPGYDPAEKREEAEKLLPLKPVMSLRTKIIHLRRVPAGAGVGYDATFVPKRPSLIGVLAAGYGDGIHRSLGNRGSVLVRGKLAPIVGIISMDVTMIDVTDIEDVGVGDVATIYGTDERSNVILANRVARSIGTVTSDLLCAVTQRVERVYVR